MPSGMRRIMNYPTGRILILSDNLALVPSALRRTLNTFYIAFQSCVVSLLHLVSAQFFVLSFRWIPSEMNNSDKGEVVSLTVMVIRANPT